MKKFKLTFALILSSLLGWSQCNVIVTADQDYCGTDQVNFNAFIPSGLCDFKWYDEETYGTEVASGCNFNATDLYCGTYTYYVEDQSVIVDDNFQAGYSIGVGPMAGAGQTGQYQSKFFRTFFTTVKEMVFNSVTIEFKDRGFSCDAEEIFIDLIEEDGTIHTFPVFVPCGGGAKHTEVVVMGVTIPAGDHEIKIRDQHNLVTYYNNGADYSAGGPLDYSEGLHITGNGNNDVTYGGIFDWDVTAKSFCPRTRVDAFTSCNPAEIAGNGIDDDCDGLVDCFDPDVFDDIACEGFYFGGEEPECMEIPDLEYEFDIVRAWQSTERVETRQTTVVGDLDGDGFPEVVTLYNDDEVIRVFDGRDGTMKTEINMTSSFANEGAGIADVDGDGFGEIFAVDADGILRAFSHDGLPKPGFTPANLINGATNDEDNAAHPSFADFNGDGMPEIYIGTEIYNAQTGALLAQSADPVNDPNGSCGFGHKFPTAFDILPDGFCPDCSGAELITGSTVYSVNLVSGVLTPVSSIPANITNNDGGASLADWNGDGLMDIVASGSCCGTGGMVAVWDPRTETMLAADAEGNIIPNNPADASTASNATSLIQIADFDGDGFPEVAIATGGRHVVLDGDLTPMWEQVFVDVSGITASTSFDFEGDGITEIIYRDEQNLYVLDGATGNIRSQFQCGSGTRTETPVIADVDNDGEAEIVCNCADSDGAGRGYLTVFESDVNPWMATRKVWNQVNYSPVFVNDDLTIPNQIQNKANIPGLDIYLSQVPTLARTGEILRPALPDFVVTVDSTYMLGGDCSAPTAKADLTICNDDFRAHLYDFDVTLYDGDPLAGGVVLSTTRLTDLNTVVSTLSCYEITLDIPVGNYDLYAVVNDDGSSPVDAPETVVEECDTTNNIHNLPVVSCEECQITLQEVDSAICIGDSVVLDPFVLSASGIGTWTIDSMPAGAVDVFLNEGIDTVFNAENLNATPGTYKLMFTNDDSGNICEDSIYITINALPVVDLGADRYICPGAANEIFDADVFDAYDWYYDAAGNTQTYESNLAGNFAVEVTDANGCVDSDTVVLFHHVLPIVDLGLDEIVCPGDSFEFNAGPFTAYSWYQLGSGTDQEFWAKAEGDYAVEVTDANGCVDSDTVVLSHHILPIADLGDDETICPGDSFEFDAGIFTAYDWYQLGSGTDQTYWSKAEGEYSVEVTDANGCVDSDTVILSYFIPPNVNLGLDRIICPGSPDEVFDATAFAGYSWYNDAAGNTQTFESNLAGNFAVEVTDLNGCVDSDTVVLSYFAGSVVDLGVDRELCPGDSFEFDAGPFVNYEWRDQGSGTNQTFMAKTTGDYIVEVEDLNGCKDTDTVALAYFAQPVVNLGPDRTICPGAANEVFNATAFAGYNWYYDAVGNTQTYETNLAGNFAVAITDLNGCVDSDTVVLNHFIPPVVNLGTDRTICPGSPNEVFDASVFAAYSWYEDAAGNAQTFETNLAGSFAVAITDLNGCVDSDTVVLSHHVAPIVSLGDDRTICPGAPNEIFDADAFAGYNWYADAAGNTQTYETNLAGSFAVEVTDLNGCVDSDTVVLSHHLPPVVNLGPDRAICPGAPNEIFDANAFAGYNWYQDAAGNTQTFETNLAGNYAVAITDLNGCADSDTVVLTIHAKPVVNLGPDQIICEGEAAVEFDAGPFDSYNWEIDAAGVDRRYATDQTGEYAVVVLDTNGCSDSDTVQLTVIPLPTPDLIADVTICPAMNQTFNVAAYDNGNGPFTYAWSDGSNGNEIIVNAAGLYWVDITDQNGCTGRDEANLSIDANLDVSIFSGPEIQLCEGEDTILKTNYNAVDGYFFTWSDMGAGNTETIVTEAVSGRYEVRVDNGLGCEGTAAINVIVNPLPILDPQDEGFCEGTSLNIGLGMGAGYDYLWSTGATTAEIEVNSTNIASPYNITVTNSATGCESATIINVTEHPNPIVEVDDAEECEGTIVVLGNNNNYADVDYLWSDGSTDATLSPLVSGDYTLTVTTLAGCEGSDDAAVIFNPIPVVDLGEQDTVTICDGQERTFDVGRQVGDVTWSNGVVEEEVTGAETEDFVVTVSYNGCEAKDSVQLIVVELPESEVDHELAKNAVCFEDLDRGLPILANTNLLYDYLWNTGDQSNAILVNGEGTYTVEISAGSCFVKDSITIRAYCPWNLNLPNAFTPNEDGLNDEFPSEFYGEFLEYELLIFNRWGEQIFQTSDIYSGWDGTYMGNDCQIDVYVYKISYRVQEENGLSEKITKIGRVSLIR